MSAERQAPRGPSRLWPFQARDEIATIIDIGAQKMACGIVSLSAPRFGVDRGARSVRVLGSAVVRSSGMSGGRIVNLTATETSIRRVVAQAEAEAGITVEDVLVTGQFHGLAAEVFEARLGAQTGLLKEDIKAISSAAEEHCAANQRKLLHLFMTAGEAGDPDGPAPTPNAPPETEVIAISMPLRGARQVAACVAKSLLTVRGYIAGPIATALAVTSAAERSTGILAIDMGAQSTGYALFVNSVPVIAECLNAGGQQISEEIANVFRLRKFEAERIKTRYGSVYDSLQADIDLPVQNGETGEPVSKFSLNYIIRAKASSVLQAVNERLKSAGYSVPMGGVVLAGGGSLLPGVRELASQLFASEVRTGQPINLNGLNAGTALSALVGRESLCKPAPVRGGNTVCARTCVPR